MQITKTKPAGFVPFSVTIDFENENEAKCIRCFLGRLSVKEVLDFANSSKDKTKEFTESDEAQFTFNLHSKIGEGLYN